MCDQVIPGCTNPTALNYVAIATWDDGSCAVLGCGERVDYAADGFDSCTAFYDCDDGKDVVECLHDDAHECGEPEWDAAVLVSARVILRERERPEL